MCWIFLIQIMLFEAQKDVLTTGSSCPSPVHFGLRAWASSKRELLTPFKTPCRESACIGHCQLGVQVSPSQNCHCWGSLQTRSWGVHNSVQTHIFLRVVSFAKEVFVSSLDASLELSIKSHEDRGKQKKTNGDCLAKPLYLCPDGTGVESLGTEDNHQHFHVCSLWGM